MPQEETRGSVRMTEAIEAIKRGHPNEYSKSRAERQVDFGFKSSSRKKHHKD